MSSNEVPTKIEELMLSASETSRTANDCFQILYGRIMTVIEAGMPEGSQCKAVKDLAGQAIWTVYNEMWDILNRNRHVTG